MSEGTGLRERKRLKAMRRVQEIALDLFDAHGFNAVTIERIAAEADVSPSSVYRYFETKEGLVLWNPQGVMISELYLRELHQLPLLDALRRLVSELLPGLPQWKEAEESHRRRTRYLVDEPAVQAALAGHMVTLAQSLAATLAERTGRKVTDLEVQVTCGALFGALLGAVRHWHATDCAEPLGDVLDRALAQLQGGLELQST